MRQKKQTEMIEIDGKEYEVETLFTFGSGKKMEKPKSNRNRNRKVTADKEIDVGV